MTPRRSAPTATWRSTCATPPSSPSSSAASGSSSKLGIDGVKADRGDENDLHGLDLALTNDYPLLFARAVMGALPKGMPAMFRAATVGSQSVVPGLWAGDQPQEFVRPAARRRRRRTRRRSAASRPGAPTSAATAAPPEDDTELFVRWAQLGAISPLMEVGGVGPNSTPWMLGPAAMAGLRDAAVLHYELFPYLYGLLRQRRPVLRPLAWGYPHDPHAWGSTYELLVGPDLRRSARRRAGDDADRVPPGR